MGARRSRKLSLRKGIPLFCITRGVEPRFLLGPTESPRAVCVTFGGKAVSAGEGERRGGDGKEGLRAPLPPKLSRLTSAALAIAMLLFPRVSVRYWR